jgi:hypothetical protein
MKINLTAKKRYRNRLQTKFSFAELSKIANI